MSISNLIKFISRGIRPVFAASIALIYFFSNVSSVYAYEKSLWNSRRDAAQKMRGDSFASASNGQMILAQLPQAAPVEFGRAVPADRSALSASNQELFAFGPKAGDWLGKMVSPYGSVRDLYLSPNTDAPFIVHIQDAHGIEEAQRNISSMIGVLTEEPGVQLVGLEGASGAIPLERYRNFPKHITKEVADLFLNRGLIAGPEYAGVTLSAAPTLFGAEDNDLHNANVTALKTAFKTKTETQTQIKTLQAKLAVLKETGYSEDLRTFDRHFNAYHARTEKLADYVRYLTGPAAQGLTAPNLALLANAVDMENGLDFKQVETERKSLVERLVSTLSTDGMETLMAKSLDHRAGRLGYGDYHAYLRRTCAQNKISLNDYPRFSSYIDYVLAADKIDHNGLLTEMDRQERTVPESLAKTDREKQLVSLTYDLALLSKLTRHEMSMADWTSYLSRRNSAHQISARIAALDPSFAGTILDAQALKPFEDFCDYAAQRNNALTGNLVRRMGETKSKAAVLVSGGFHTEGLTALLREKQISYVVVTPKISAIPNDNNYLNILASDPIPLEKQLAGDRIYLSKPLGLGGSQPQTGDAMEAIASVAAGADKSTVGKVTAKVARKGIVIAGKTIQVTKTQREDIGLFVFANVGLAVSALVGALWAAPIVLLAVYVPFVSAHFKAGNMEKNINQKLAMAAILMERELTAQESAEFRQTAKTQYIVSLLASSFVILLLLSAPGLFAILSSLDILSMGFFTAAIGTAVSIVVTSVGSRFHSHYSKIAFERISSGNFSGFFLAPATIDQGGNEKKLKQALEKYVADLKSAKERGLPTPALPEEIQLLARELGLENMASSGKRSLAGDATAIPGRKGFFPENFQTFTFLDLVRLYGNPFLSRVESKPTVPEVKLDARKDLGKDLFHHWQGRIGEIEARAQKKLFPFGDDKLDTGALKPFGGYLDEKAILASFQIPFRLPNQSSGSNAPMHSHPKKTPWGVFTAMVVSIPVLSVTFALDAVGLNVPVMDILRTLAVSAAVYIAAAIGYNRYLRNSLPEGSQEKLLARAQEIVGSYGLGSSEISLEVASDIIEEPTAILDFKATPGAVKHATDEDGVIIIQNGKSWGDITGPEEVYVRNAVYVHTHEKLYLNARLAGASEFKLGLAIAHEMGKAAFARSPLAQSKYLRSTLAEAYGNFFELRYVFNIFFAGWIDLLFPFGNPIQFKQIFSRKRISVNNPIRLDLSHDERDAMKDSHSFKARIILQITNLQNGLRSLIFDWMFLPAWKTPVDIREIRSNSKSDMDLSSDFQSYDEMAALKANRPFITRISGQFKNPLEGNAKNGELFLLSHNEDRLIFTNSPTAKWRMRLLALSLKVNMSRILRPLSETQGVTRAIMIMVPLAIFPLIIAFLFSYLLIFLISLFVGTTNLSDQALQDQMAPAVIQTQESETFVASIDLNSNIPVETMPGARRSNATDEAKLVVLMRQAVLEEMAKNGPIAADSVMENPATFIEEVLRLNGQLTLEGLVTQAKSSGKVTLPRRFEIEVKTGAIPLSGILAQKVFSVTLSIKSAVHYFSVLSPKLMGSNSSIRTLMIGMLMPFIETIGLAALAPHLSDIVTFLGFEPTTMMMLAVAGLIFSVTHVFLLTLQGERVTAQQTLIWALGGMALMTPFLFLSLPLAFGVSLLIHSGLNILKSMIENERIMDKYPRFARLLRKLPYFSTFSADSIARMNLPSLYGMIGDKIETLRKNLPKGFNSESVQNIDLNSFLKLLGERVPKNKIVRGHLSGQLALLKRELQGVYFSGYALFYHAAKNLNRPYSPNKLGTSDPFPDENISESDIAVILGWVDATEAQGMGVSPVGLTLREFHNSLSSGSPIDLRSPGLKRFYQYYQTYVLNSVLRSNWAVRNEISSQHQALLLYQHLLWMQGQAKYPNLYPTEFNSFIDSGNLEMINKFMSRFFSQNINSVDGFSTKKAINGLESIDDFLPRGKLTDHTWMEHRREILKFWVVFFFEVVELKKLNPKYKDPAIFEAAYRSAMGKFLFYVYKDKPELEKVLSNVNLITAPRNREAMNAVVQNLTEKMQAGSVLPTFLGQNLTYTKGYWTLSQNLKTQNPTEIQSAIEILESSEAVGDSLSQVVTALGVAPGERLTVDWVNFDQWSERTQTEAKAMVRLMLSNNQPLYILGGEKPLAEMELNQQERQLVAVNSNASEGMNMAVVENIYKRSDHSEPLSDVVLVGEKPSVNVTGTRFKTETFKGIAESIQRAINNLLEILRNA